MDTFTPPFRERAGFTSRFGVLVAMLGMAVGTGNIWRFPRVLAQNGGGAFLIPWAIFLILWSLPLLMIEFSLGRRLRRGVIGCFAALTDGRWVWVGGFVVFCTLGILCYYSVVTGWCLYYALTAASGSLFASEPRVVWERLAHAGTLPLALHALCLGLACVAVRRVVQHGIERVNRWMVPTLVIILLGLAGYALTIPGSAEGWSFIFHVDGSRLADAHTWLEALTQSAWSTGAGWGLALTYACYARERDDPVTTPLLTGLGNNVVEILAALAIIPPLFAYFAPAHVQQMMGEGNTGLTFVSLPALFQRMPHGRWLSPLFFTALFCAAFTSLVAMVELGVRFLEDLGLSRRRGIHAVGAAALVVGGVSAWNLRFLENQDWVWGLGLLLSGFLFARLANRVGAGRMWREFIGRGGRLWARGFGLAVRWLLPAEFIVVLAWWFWQSMRSAPQDWYHPLQPFSVGTCLLQWGLLIVGLLLANRYLLRRLHATFGADPAGRPSSGAGYRLPQ